MTRPRTPLRAAGAAVTSLVAAVALAVAVGTGVAAGAASLSPTAMITAPSAGATVTAVTLLGQSTWVGDHQTFVLRLGVDRSVPSTDRIVVTAYPRLTNRTDFDAAANGRFGAAPGAAWIGQESVGAAPPAAHGGVLARIPVDTLIAQGDLQTEQAFYPGDQSGVYPLQVQLIGADETAVGAAVSTFLVYSAGQAAFPKLLTSVTVPLIAHLTLSPALRPTRLPPVWSSRLSSLSAILASHPDEALSLAVAPLTAESLAAGSAVDRTTLDRLAVLVGRGDELLPVLDAPVSPASLAASGLADQIAPQLEAGARALDRTLRARPEMSTWVIGGPTDEATLQLLRSVGLRRLVTPEKALSALPVRLVTTTYARPTHLHVGPDGGATAGGGTDGGRSVGGTTASDLRVFGADATVAARVTEPAGPVLAAEQTLAEMAMIELETPSIERGVALVLPGPASVSPAYLATLLGGLHANPFLQPATATRLLTRLPVQPPGIAPATAQPAPGSQVAAIAAVPVRTLKPVRIPGVPAAGTLRALDRDIHGLAGFLPADTALTDRLRRQLLIAPAAGLTPGWRQALLGSMTGVVHATEHIVRLPGNTSVTLTSLKATLPLIVNSDVGVSPHVRLVLASPKLGFRAFRPPDGSCRVDARTTEVCTMVLHGPETVLRVPVEARTSGVFALDVMVTSPDGSLTLATARDTVRSTAVSSVGIVIIVVSLLFLGIWWIRDIHSGRRARQLVQRPGDDIGDGGDGDGPPDGGLGPPPPLRPRGPSEPTEPRLVAPPPVTVGEPAGSGTGGRRHRQPHPPAHREPRDPQPARDAPAGRRKVSPSKWSIGPTP